MFRTVRDLKPSIPKRLRRFAFPRYDYPLLKTVVGYDSVNYFEQVRECYGQLANPFWYYRGIVEELLNIGNLKIVPLYELMSCTADGTRVVAMRHDIDADPATGLRCARYLAKKGICGSFYLLHTAPYYGVFYGDHFIRNPQVAEWVLGFVVSGCELGLHNDCLKVYREYDKDGAEALKTEIEWLRANGARIYGTVAHNSGPAYGAENSEIFRGRRLWQRNVKTPSAKSIPLGSVSEKKMGLTYEGSFTKVKRDINSTKASRFFAASEKADIRSKEWMYNYLVENPCFDWTIDYQFWLINRNEWVIAGEFEGEFLFEWKVGLRRMLEFLDALPPGSRSVLIIHPAYISRDH